MSNTVQSLQDTITIAATTTGTAIDVLLAEKLSVYVNVANGPASGGGDVTVTLQGCDEDSDTAADWVTLSADGTDFPLVDATDDANPWPKSYIENFSTFFRYIRPVFTLTGTDNWTLEVRMLIRTAS